MRKVLFGLAALAGVGMIHVLPAAAQVVTVFPWCADNPEESTDCSFATWQQCQADASGLGGFCYANPNYANPSLDERPRLRMR